MILPSDQAAIARYVAQLSDPSVAELYAIKLGVGSGMSSVADMLDEMAHDEAILGMLRRDPADGLRRIAARLRKAVPA